MGGDRVRVEVLGPIRVLAPGDREITPPGVLQRRLLALLVLRRGRVVPADTAIEVLWPSTLPRDPAGALQNHLSRLRRALPAGLIESVGDGYRLDPSAVDVDGDRLAAALGAGVALGDGAAPDAATLADLDAVLDRWHGPPYPELDGVDDARAEATHLAELRVRALEVRAEQRLARGATDGLVAELTALADAEPLRERPRALLMAALATTGRHAEALRVYDDFRRLLGDELGIEPSPLLAAQHAALLDRGPGAPGGPVDGMPDAAGGWVPATRLPVPATSLIGRGHLAAEIAALVGPQRLVSLVGPGGVGKTRLLVEVGYLLRAAEPDRPVVLCELAAADAAAATDAIAASLGIDVRPGVPLADRIAGVLGDAPLVLLVDNCEHVLEPVAELVDHLLGRCPNVAVVTTSRERLRVPGERLCPVPPLPVEGDDSPAVQLFVERARAATPDFAPDADELAVASDIVRRLDGLPLAIELAAARLFTHDVGEVAAGLDHRFSLLTAGYRTSPRHASLGAAVSWSFGLLDEPLQQFFAALSVFSGSFTPADAAAVCALGVEETTVALTQLAERSLVMRAPGRRYVLLETLRAFGAEQLAATGRDEAVGGRHARHLVAWAERAERRLPEPGGSAIADIDAAVPELHTALGWLLDHGEAELAGRLVAALLDYGFLRLRPDVLAWSERVTAVDPDDRSPMAPRVWVVAAYAAWMAGDVPEAGVRSARALALAERAADRTGSDVPPQVASARGSIELFEGRLDTAARWFRRAVQAGDGTPHRLIGAAAEVLALGYAGHPDAAGRADALLAELGGSGTPYAAYAWYSAGEADLAAGDLDRARGRYVRAVELAHQTNASFITGLAGASKASIDARVGDPEVAAGEFRRVIAHWRRAGMWSTQWTMLRSIAALVARLGRHRDAAVLVGALHATAAGHRIFGADEVALHELGRRLRDALGDDAYEAALADGAVLDGDAAVEHALRAL
ncbi:MAG TPA: BTAD domain-containing putative transcriptional regulator [Acidimicrobiales bacterium]